MVDFFGDAKKPDVGSDYLNRLMRDRLMRGSGTGWAENLPPGADMLGMRTDLQSPEQNMLGMQPGLNAAPEWKRTVVAQPVQTERQSPQTFSAPTISQPKVLPATTAAPILTPPLAPTIQPRPAERPLSEIFAQELAEIQRKNPGITEDQKNRIAEQFYLSLMAKGSERSGRGFLGNMAEAGLGALAGRDLAEKESRLLSEKEYQDNVTNLFRKVGFEHQTRQDTATQRNLDNQEKRIDAQTAASERQHKDITRKMDDARISAERAAERGDAREARAAIASGLNSSVALIRDTEAKLSTAKLSGDVALADKLETDIAEYKRNYTDFSNKLRELGGVSSAAPDNPNLHDTTLPKGLVVGAATKQPDGVYNAAGRKVTIRGGKVAEIK